MKKIVILFLLINWLASLVYAESIYTYSPQGAQRNIFRRSASGYDMYDNMGNRKGRIRNYSNGTNVLYDQDNTRTKVFRKTAGGHTNVFDNSGNKVGTIRTLSNGQAYSYDQYGNRTGSFRTYPGGRGVMYDNFGNRRGTFRTRY